MMLTIDLKHQLARLFFLTLIGVSFMSCYSTYVKTLGHNEVRFIVVHEVQQVRGLEVKEDFIRWSIDEVESTCAPENLERARRMLVQGFHDFIEGVVDFAKERGYQFLTAATGRTYLRTSVTCGKIPCDTKKCCDFCQRPCR
jgi:hypothetical protein